MNSIEWLQSWYRIQCNDEWEHQHGIIIETLDNPGWVVRIDLTGTSLEGKRMKPVACTVNHSGIDGKNEWMDCKTENNQFVGAGGPTSLIQICEVFMNWVEAQK